MQANVVVVGSLNMDLVTRAQRLPQAGETLAGESFFTVPGGKGANQAVAAARLGAQVAMVGCVGADAYGQQLRDALLGEGIDCQAVAIAEGVSSGVALIVVDASSQNAIVIVAGGNGQLSPASVMRFDALLQSAEVIICQLEVPAETVEYTLARGHALGKTVILNPAPATGPLPAHWFGHIDYLIPNESEAAALTGLPVNDLASAKVAATHLLALGVGKVIVTLGAQGAVFADGTGFEHFAAPVVQPLDTTAAGDTFVGGFAAMLARGEGVREAIAFGQQAAAISVTRAGAQPSIPYLLEVQTVVTA
ncbi:ribokinase [Pseudomonas fontis]|uniref:Ribokinase n=1 Tax=Pseudomonas fontis TaxID=2942633 RepID=A0ABT5NM16_9PSED|nr:ribokinase [Pseudomonas fontis]MDD0974913.1 ribokinase [Pseudomonas fontis]MDD0989354.1 ribokinase [Pseudomonas fontis]